MPDPVIQVTIDSVDVTEYILFQGTSITDSLGNIKGLDLRAKEGAVVADGDELVILDKTPMTRIFGGYVKELSKKLLKKDYLQQRLLAQDYTRLIDLITEGVSYQEETLTEFAWLTQLMADHAPSIIVDAAYVISPGESVTFGWENTNLRKALDDVSGQYGRIWYVDYNKYLHYFLPGDEAAPFGLSDASDGVTTFPYIDLDYTTDVVGSVANSTLKCWKSGLFSGMTIQVTNNKFGWAAREFLIYEVTGKLVAGDMYVLPTWEYTLAIGDNPPRGSKEQYPRRLSDRVSPITYTNQLQARKEYATSRAILWYISGELAIGASQSASIPSPFDFEGTSVYLKSKVAPVGADIIVDVNLDDVSIFTTQANRPRIVAGQTEGQSVVPDVNKFRLNEILTVDIDQVGSDVAGTGLTIQIRGLVSQVVYRYVKTAVAKARMLKRFTKTCTAKARMLRRFTKTTTAKARMLYRFSKTATAKAQILRRFTKTSTALARVSAHLTKTTTAKANIAS